MNYGGQQLLDKFIRRTARSFMAALGLLVCLVLVLLPGRITDALLIDWDVGG
jgi:hypothetical protein